VWSSTDESRIIQVAQVGQVLKIKCLETASLEASPESIYYDNKSLQHKDNNRCNTKKAADV